MGMPLFDCAVRTSAVLSGQALVQLVPPALALGTGRLLRLREVSISNTTATAFGVGLGIATAAAVTPATAGVIMRRSNSVSPVDPASASLVWSTFGTTPTAPAGFSKRFWIPANSLVIYSFAEGEELMISPSATPLPFCVFNTGVGQIADVSLTWEE